MSENENQPAPSKQTSSVPLKKETVRVTLKAADAPPAVAPPAPTVAPPVATVPGSAPVVRPPTPSAPGAPAAPTVGGAPRPPGPAPTIPLKPVGAPTAPGMGAPTIRLATAPGPGSTGAPTIPLRPSGAPTAPGAGPTVALPKATVQLQAPTQPLGTARPTLTQSPTLQGEEEEDEGSGETVGNVLSIVGFIAAIALLAFQLMISNTWVGADYVQNPGEEKGTPKSYNAPAESPADRSLLNELFASEQ